MKNKKTFLIAVVFLAFAFTGIQCVSADTNTARVHPYIANILGWQEASIDMAWTFQTDQYGYISSSSVDNEPHVAWWAQGNAFATILGTQTSTSSQQLSDWVHYELKDSAVTINDVMYNIPTRISSTVFVVYYGNDGQYQSSSQYIPFSFAIDIKVN